MSELENLAKELIRNPSDRQAEAALWARLAKLADADELRAMGKKYFPDTEVSIPIYERILQLKPGDLAATVALGILLFLNGEDDRARKQLEIAREANPDDAQTLTLQAALARDPDERIRIYRSILEKDPHNRVARANLDQAPGQARMIYEP